MPRAYPEEFRQRAVELARQRAKPISQIAADLGIAQSVLHRWVRQADIDAGQRHDGLTTDEHAELVRLRRANRVLEMENEILKRAAAFFARGRRRIAQHADHRDPRHVAWHVRRAAGAR